MFSTAGMARISARHPWRVIAAWTVLIVVAIAIAVTSLGDAFTSKSDFTNRPESTVGADLLKARMYGGQDQPLSEIVIVHADGATVDDPAFQATVEQTAAALQAMPQIVAGTFTYYDTVAAGAPDDAGLVSADRHSTLIGVTLAGDLDQAKTHVEEYLAAIEQQQVDGYQIVTVGDITVDDEFSRLAEEDLATARASDSPPPCSC